MARTRVRYALVAELGSGLRATLSSHRRVEWANEEKAKSFLKTYPMIAQGAADDQWVTESPTTACSVHDLS